MFLGGSREKSQERIRWSSLLVHLVEFSWLGTFFRGLRCSKQFFICYNKSSNFVWVETKLSTSTRNKDRKADTSLINTTSSFHATLKYCTRQNSLLSLSLTFFVAAFRLYCLRNSPEILNLSDDWSHMVFAWPK